MKKQAFRYDVSYYRMRLSELAAETFDPNPDFPFSTKQTRTNSNIIVEQSQGSYKIYVIESLRGVFRKSLTSYIANVSVGDNGLNIVISIKKAASLFYTFWLITVLSFIIYMISINNFTWILFAIMTIAASIHLPLGKKKFKAFVVQFLNSL